MTINVREVNLLEQIWIVTQILMRTAVPSAIIAIVYVAHQHHADHLVEGIGLMWVKEEANFDYHENDKNKLFLMNKI